jgi:hypothetical protein
MEYRLLEIVKAYITAGRGIGNGNSGLFCESYNFYTFHTLGNEYNKVCRTIVIDIAVVIYSPHSSRKLPKPRWWPI